MCQTLGVRARAVSSVTAGHGDAAASRWRGREDRGKAPPAWCRAGLGWPGMPVLARLGDDGQPVRSRRRRPRAYLCGLGSVPGGPAAAARDKVLSHFRLERRPPPSFRSSLGWGRTNTIGPASFSKGTRGGVIGGGSAAGCRERQARHGARHRPHRPRRQRTSAAAALCWQVEGRCRGC